MSSKRTQSAVGVYVLIDASARVVLTRLQFRIRGERKAAEFSFAGVVAYAEDEKTGNLVPEGEEIPSSANGRKR